MVRTDHYSLKFLLDQRLSMIPQHHWASKLLGFDFRVEFKPGKQNIVADALSRRDAEPGVVMALSAPQFSLFDELHQATTLDPNLTALRALIEAGELEAPWALVDGVVTFDGRAHIPASSDLLPRVLAMAHEGGA